MDWTAWRHHFEQNRLRPLPDLAAAGLGLDDALRAVLADTIAVLQAGETGEGRIVHQVRREGLGDAHYQAAIDLFVREEGRHAAILGRALKALGGRPKQDAWAARWFTAARGLVGARPKLVVLLSAEVVAVCLYESLSEHLPPGPLRAALEQIGDDELHHLEFHADFFRSLPRAQRALFRLAWWPVCGTASVVVLVDHRGTLRALAADRGRLVRRLFRAIAHVDRRVAAHGEPRWSHAGVPTPSTLCA